MKLVIIDTTICGPVIGGAQTFLPGLLKGLVEDGHEVHLVSKDVPNGRVKNEIEKSGATMHTRIWKKNRLVEDTAPVFAKWVNDLKPDVYVVSVSADIGWVVLPYLNPSIATVTIGHTDDKAFYLPAKYYSSFLTTAIGVSHEVCRHYIMHCNLSSDNVQWISYGVAVMQTHPERNNTGILKLVYAGRLEEAQKRISDIAAIAKSLFSLGIKFNFKIAGDGPQMSFLKENLASEIADKKVELLGWRDSKEVIKIFRESDLFVLASNYEGFCIALIEAMANGCCPLVTDIKSGNKELVTDNENGFVIPIGDIEAFVQKIEWLNTNPERLFEFREKAWLEAKKYSIASMVDSYKKMFIKSAEKAVSNPRRADDTFPLMPNCRSPYPLWIRRIKRILVAD